MNNLNTLTRFLIIPCFTLILAFSGCQHTGNLTISFCKALYANDQCPGDQNTFEIGGPLFVRLTADEPFAVSQITGKIFRMHDKDEMIFLGQKNFEIEPGQAYLTQSIPFDEFGMEALGDFKVIFYDEKDQILAQRGLTITTKQ